MTRLIRDPKFAKTIFALYREHGLGQFANWLTMKKDSVKRAEVVDALRYDDTRKAALKQIEFYQMKIEELRSMLEESASA